MSKPSRSLSMFWPCVCLCLISTCTGVLLCYLGTADKHFPKTSFGELLKTLLYWFKKPNPGRPMVFGTVVATEMLYTPWQSNMAMENSTFIDDFLNKNWQKKGGTSRFHLDNLNAHLVQGCPSTPCYQGAMAAAGGDSKMLGQLSWLGVAQVGRPR